MRVRMEGEGIQQELPELPGDLRGLGKTLRLYYFIFLGFFTLFFPKNSIFSSQKINRDEPPEGENPAAPNLF